jgi:hypothetical protein
MIRKIFLLALLVALFVGVVLAGGNLPVALGIAGLTALALQLETRRGSAADPFNEIQ